MKTTALAILMLLPMTSFSKEIPGKSVLFPHNEIKEINYSPSHLGSITKASDHFRVKVLKGRVSYKLAFKFSDISKLSIIKQIPQLRGRLIDVYDVEDKAFLTKTFLRIRLKEKFNDIDDIYLSLDFKISKENQSQVLEEDITLVDKLNLKTFPVVLSHHGIHQRITKYSKTFRQFPLDLRPEEAKLFLEKYLSNLNLATQKPFSSKENNSSLLLLNSLDEVLKETRGSEGLYATNNRLFRRGRDARRYNRLHIEEKIINPWLIEENLERRNLKTDLDDWRQKRLDDEFCYRIGYEEVPTCPQNIKFNWGVFGSIKHREGLYSFYASRLEKLQPFVEESLEELQVLIDSRMRKDPDYIHMGMQEKLDRALEKLLFADNMLLKLLDQLNGDDLVEKTDLENTINRFRAVLWSSYLKTLLKNDDFDEIRFYDEGGFYHQYPRFFVKDAIPSVMKLVKGVKPFNWSQAGLESLGEFLSKQNLLTHEEAYEIESNFISSDIEVLGTSLGEGLVNILGQVFKKRKWVPYIRVATMFRGSFMTERRDYVFGHLFDEKGMKPGDIILEKDLKANTDVLIPGYWVHASIYLGTIKDLKNIGVWDHPDFSIIQYEIEKYRTSKDRQHYLNEEWKNKLPFDEVPWFYESDRTGVAVHPLHKFLYTDGMAVLRPNGAWNKPQLMDMYKRANERMYFPYDYVHNTRNKFYVSCSKVVLKVFNNVTFPVSKNLNYISVSPDQIGQAVAVEEGNKDLGPLKLIMFFDAYDKGNLRYHYKKPETFGGYSTFLEASGGTP